MATVKDRPFYTGKGDAYIVGNVQAGQGSELYQDESLKVESRTRTKRKTCVVIMVCVLIILLTAAIVVPLTSDFSDTKTKKSAKRTVLTDCGPVEGRMDEQAAVYVFKGIPYAKPPVGPLRWKPPIGLRQAGECWNGTFLATNFGNTCAQVGETILGSEDCLYVNVLMPARQQARLLPVLVWIHGGALVVGSGSEIGPGAVPGYFPNAKFVQEMNVVAVSFNYRLNAFGFLTLDVLSEISPTNTSGNYGVMDQILLLQWVQSNIAAFGGDRAKVTLLGQSSGGTSIFGLLAADSAQGLFRAVISMSGSPVFNKTSTEASKDNLVFLKRSNCEQRTSNETLSCLYRLSTVDVLKAAPFNEFPYWSTADLGNIPVPGQFDGALIVVDGDVIKYPPMDLAKYQTGLLGNVTIVIGDTAQEVGIKTSHHFGPKEYESYVNVVTKELGAFLNATDTTKAIDFYVSLTATVANRPQYEYETLVTDLRVICATDVLARNFSLSPRHDVYRYIASTIPSHPIEYSGTQFSFAFHTWDTFALFGFKLPTIFSPRPTDLNFMELIQTQFKSIIEHGRPRNEDWSPFPDATCEFGAENLTMVGAQGYHHEQCRFWLDRGFFSYSWIN